MQSAVTESMMAGASPKVTIRISASPEGGFTAECLEIPGCVSEGESVAEAEGNIRKAIDACLSVIFEDLLVRIRPTAVAAESDRGVAHEIVSIHLPRLANEAA